MHEKTAAAGPLRLRCSALDVVRSAFASGITQPSTINFSDPVRHSPFHPVNRLSVERLLNSDTSHRSRRRERRNMKSPDFSRRR
jgi:hypothetical protein